MFSEDLLSRNIKTRACLGKGLPQFQILTREIFKRLRGKGEHERKWWFFPFLTLPALWKTFSSFASVPSSKIFDQSKFKEFADDKSKVAHLIKLACNPVENSGKRRKCWFPAFSPFSTLFSKAFYIRVVKTWDWVAKNYFFLFKVLSICLTLSQTSNFSFSTCLENFPSYSSNLKLSAKSFSLDGSKFCNLGKG